MEGGFVYGAEYALTDRSSCKRCRKSISKNTLRLSIMEQAEYHDGKVAAWHHPKCFYERERHVKVHEIWNFYNLRWTDQLRVRKLAGETLPEEESGSEEETAEEPKTKGKRGLKHELGPSKKAKKTAVKEDAHTAAMHIQTDALWTCRSDLGKLTKKAMTDFLTANDQNVPVAGQMLDRLADLCVFGAPEKCTVCASDTGHLAIKPDGYYCQGSVSEWAKCDFKTQSPARKAVVVPDDLLKGCSFLKKYAGTQPRDRVFPLCFQKSKDGVDVETSKSESGNTSAEPSTSEQLSEEDVKTAAMEKMRKKFKPTLPLNGLEISAVGTLEQTRAEMKKIIEALGGKYVTKVSDKIFAVISDATNVGGYHPAGGAMQLAITAKVPVLPLEFLSECEEEKLKKHDDLVELVQRQKLNNWDWEFPWNRTSSRKNYGGVSNTEQHRQMETWKKQCMVNFAPAKPAKVVVKNGGAVDSNCGLDLKRNSVYRNDNIVYSYVLALTSVTDGSNSFYKMQIIKNDNISDRFHLFRSWGRIGTTIGGKKCDKMNLDEAIKEFEHHFLQKTGNEWKDRQALVKKPSKYFIMELDYGPEESSNEPTVVPGSKTKLPLSLQDVIKLIFDEEEMRMTMKTFEIDMKKMPLGKLSRKQILEAMTVLSEIQTLIDADERKDSPKLIGATNRFFTLIPHDFGVQLPPILNDSSLVKTKLEMLENLMEIEVAFDMIRRDNKNSTEDPIDLHYEKLKCKMDVLEKEAPEYKQICDYAENTHAATHSHYKLEVTDIFCVARDGENERFNKYRALHNHKLLWHGSRTTNYAGILSQGLRIAPPEAPTQGYMFGKGVYFADMVTKSANYCFPNSQNPVGLMLLSDVALGNMYELAASKYVDKLEGDFHSTKGCGRTFPDPKESVTLADGVEIPMGRTQTTGLTSSLLYNEYIVYDEAQVNLRYLLKVKFHYK